MGEISASPEGPACHDAVVVGAGIIGLAVAEALVRTRPGMRLAVVDKETRLAAHQTGRNSGVIHSGIYYPPGSLKARCTAVGRQALLEFCETEGIRYELCGKVIVATDDAEAARLEALADRARHNGVAARPLRPAELCEREPHVSGIAALLVPGAGIVDFRAVCRALAARVEAAGGAIYLGRTVTGLHEGSGGVVVETDGGELHTRLLVNCAGLQSDRVAALAGASRRDVRIVPFRGEYYELAPHRRHLVRHLVYPVPDPAFPFLGVHFTRMTDGGVHAGPNAVLALAREGYDWRTVDPRDLWDALSFPGFWRLARRHAATGLGELHRSLRRAAFVRALRRLVPDIRERDLIPAEAGVRAQALRSDGRLVDDFVFARSAHVLNVVNAPSPAATASLAIGRVIVGRLADRLPATAR